MTTVSRWSQASTALWGFGLNVPDAIILATARCAELTLATRNSRQPEQTSCTATVAIETTYTAARDQLKGLLETVHLLRSPRNAARLLSALERARSEELPALRLEDLEARLKA